MSWIPRISVDPTAYFISGGVKRAGEDTDRAQGTPSCQLSREYLFQRPRIPAIAQILARMQTLKMMEFSMRPWSKP